MNDNPFPQDNRPRFNCLNQNHPGPFYASGDWKGLVCKTHFLEAQKLFGWRNPYTNEDLTATGEGIPK